MTHSLLKTSTIVVLCIVIAHFSTTIAELIECKFAEDTDICVFDHVFDYNHVYDFRPQPNATVNNITKISFLQPVPLDVDEIMHRLCDIFYNLHEVYINSTSMYCDVNLYTVTLVKTTTTTTVISEMEVEDVSKLHNEMLEEVVRKGTIKGSDVLHQKLNLIVIAIGSLIFIFLLMGILLLIRYIRKRRQDRLWRRSRFYSSRYGHNI